MALTYSAIGSGTTRVDLGAVYGELGVFTCDASYPTGGYSVPNGVGLQTILGMIQAGNSTTGAGYDANYNTTTGKFQVFWAASAGTGATVVVAGSSTATSLPLVMFPATGNAGVLGVTAAQATQTIPAATFGINFAAAGKFSEVSNGTSLTGVSFTMLTIGY